MWWYLQKKYQRNNIRSEDARFERQSRKLSISEYISDAEIDPQMKVEVINLPETSQNKTSNTKIKTMKSLQFAIQGESAVKFAFGS